MCLSDPSELYQWESCTPGRSNQAEQVCGVEARLCASVTPQSYISGSLVLLAGLTKLNRSVG